MDVAYAKLDVGILDSTLWMDKAGRDVFITALLMATPREFTEPQPQLEVRTIRETGFVAPPGWYGFVEAAGVGIVRRALVDVEEGLAALERLGAPDPESRSSGHDGRRMIRVSGGYLILNFMQYRERDHTAAIRAQRYRQKVAASRRDVTPSRRDVTPERRNVTEAEAEAEADRKEETSSLVALAKPSRPSAFDGKNLEAVNGRALLALATDWELPESWGLDAEALGWKPGEVLREAERFRQYWTAGRGQGTRRSVKGWRQSWSNWLAKAAERQR